MKTRSMKLISALLLAAMSMGASTSALADGRRGPYQYPQHQPQPVQHHRSGPSSGDVFGAVLGAVVIGAIVNEATRPQTTYVAPAPVYNYYAQPAAPIGYSTGAPSYSGYYAPAPVYMAPTPVYVRPAPVYVQPQVSVVCDGRGYCYEQRPSHHRHHGYRY